MLALLHSEAKRDYPIEDAWAGTGDAHGKRCCTLVLTRVLTAALLVLQFRLHREVACEAWIP